MARDRSTFRPVLTDVERLRDGFVVDEFSAEHFGGNIFVLVRHDCTETHLLMGNSSVCETVGNSGTPGSTHRLKKET